MVFVVVGAVGFLIWMLYRLDRKSDDFQSLPRNIEPPSRPSVARPYLPLPPVVPSAPATSAEVRPPARAANAPYRWIPKDELIEVQRFLIPGGQLYFGRSMARVDGYGVEPALIDPSLPVQATGGTPEMPYWPSYTDVSAAARGAYLRWLCGGRCDSGVDIGLVFLFFYGLERRVLREKDQVSETEWEQIRVEVVRLLGIYGENNSFRKYAIGLLGILGSTKIDGDTLALNPPVVTRYYESANLPLKTGLGWMAKNGRPIPANWALAWVRSTDTYRERTPASRCREQFECLFAIRYQEQFGEGALVKPNKTVVKGSYRPASSSFSGDVNLSLPGLPDITVLKQPIEKLAALAHQCAEDLDPYSRYLGRNPDDTSSVAALSLLPARLVERAGHETLERIQAWLQEQLAGNEMAVVGYQQLRGVWDSLPAESITKRDAVMLAQCLGTLGYGVEPDTRFGAHQMGVDSPMVLFRLPAGAPTAPSPEYRSSALLAHLGAVLAHADDRVAPEEEEALLSHAARSLELSEAERARLKTYMKWLLLTPPEVSGLKKRIESLTTEQRSHIATFLSRLAGLDGHVSPEEIVTLQKVYRQLGLNPDAVFADTHSAATEPVTVRPAEDSIGYAIPVQPPPRQASISRVNLDRVRAMEMESQQVSSLLADIFTGEEENVGKSEQPAAPTAVVIIRVLDLDAPHSRFVLSLVERHSWSRAELESLAAEHRLMPDGAIDAVNEAALDLHGEPLLEGDDPVEVNPTLRSVVQP